MWPNFRWMMKQTKMKTKKLFSFSPPILPVFFSFFDRELVWSAVFNFDNVEDNNSYYTHYIRWIIEPKSKQKTTCYYNYIQQKLKNEMKKPDVCLEEKTQRKEFAKVYKKTNLFLFDDFSVYSKVEFTLRNFWISIYILFLPNYHWKERTRN